MTIYTVSDNSLFLRKSYSRITLALLKDTGWYADVDLSIGETHTFGLGKGCDFVIGSCTDNDDMCQVNNAKACDNHYYASGYCKVNAYQDITPDCQSNEQYMNSQCDDVAGSSSPWIPYT
jgi:hypothetical protein